MTETMLLILGQFLQIISCSIQSNKLILKFGFFCSIQKCFFLYARFSEAFLMLLSVLLSELLHSHYCFIFQSNASKKDRDDFLSEAAILAQFNDSHVISVEGVILKGVWKLVMCFGQVFQKIQSDLS